MSEKPRVRVRRKMARQEPGSPKPVRFVSPVRLKNLLWLPLLGGIAWAVAAHGTPHLRFEAEYTGSYDHPHYLRCDYIGWHRWTLRPIDGECPLFILFKSGGA